MGQGMGWPWGTTTRWPSSSSSVSWVGSAGYSRDQGGCQGHSLVLDLTRKFHPPMLPASGTGLPAPFHLVNLQTTVQAGLSVRPTLPHCSTWETPTHPSVCDDTSSLKPSWIPRNDLLNGKVKYCREDACGFLPLCTAPSLLAAPCRHPRPWSQPHFHSQACAASQGWDSPGSVWPRAISLLKWWGG